MVYNANYCSIEDAWGNLTGPAPKIDKKKKKKSRDPICELYDMSANASYDDLELVRAANSLEFDRYNKSRYQKDRQAFREKEKYFHLDLADEKETPALYEQKASDDIDLDKQFASSIQNAQCSKTGMKLPDFESHFNPLSSPDDDNESDVQSEADYKEFKHILNKKKSVEEEEEEEVIETPRKKKNVNESFADDDVAYIFDKKRPSSMPYLDLLLYIVSGIILIFVMEQFVKIGMLLQ